MIRSAAQCGLGLLLLALLAVPTAWAQNASISGTVTDASDGLPLAGATVEALVGNSSRAGIVTDIDGRYALTGLAAGTYTVRVRYLGYNENESLVTLADNERRTLNIAMQQGGLELDAVVISASRQAEKVLDAPASISVLDARDIERDVAPSPSTLLRNTVGTDVVQTGVDRYEVVLRGFNNAFSGSAYVLTDYRQASAPSLGVNIYSIMPANSVDLEQVEIVRGPGSALYGPGVDEGVIHYFTKDPFRHPGTTVSLMGGERSMFSGALRHAGVFGENIGYKIIGNYAQAEDWGLDANDPADAAQLAGDFVYADPNTAPSNQDVDATTGRLLRNDDYMKYNVHGEVQYRFDAQTTLAIAGGRSGLTSTVLSGIGTLQADDFGYSYGQIRLQSGGFFAQAYLNRNSAGDSYVYGTGQTVVDKSLQFNAQAQYNTSYAQGRHRLILGADFEQVTPDTDETIYGRFEDDAKISEIGAYAQTTLSLSPMLDLTLAARGDYNNIVETFQVSPRVAAVFKPTNGHSFRASYNRAFSSPGNNSLFLDIEAQRITYSTGQSLIFYGRGSADGVTFDNFRSTNTARFSLPGTLFGTDLPISAMPLQAFYGVFAAGLEAQFNAAIAAGPAGIAQLPAPFNGLAAPQLQAVIGLVNGLTVPIGAATTDAAVATAVPTDISPLDQTTSQVFELGYKGIFADRVLIAVDGYLTNKKNFVGPLTLESPIVVLNSGEFTGDLAAALAPILQGIIANDPVTAGFLASLGLDAASTAGLLASNAAAAFGTNPVAVVQPDQEVVAPGTANAVGGFLGYRNFGDITYWGVDAAIQFLASDNLTLFGNISLVSDDFFDNEELDEANTSLGLALNAPTFKGKLGFNVTTDMGLSFGAAGRYVDSFPVLSGPYVGGVPASYRAANGIPDAADFGPVEDYFLLDLNLGFDFKNMIPGLRADVAVQNLLDDSRREFVGGPQIGRMALGRLTYSF